MRVIRLADKSGTIHNFNPRYIKDIKIVHSEYNENWCIDIIFGDDASSNQPIYTVVCATEEEATAMVEEMVAAMES